MGWSFMSKIPSDDVLKSTNWLRKRESAQLKNRIGVVRHGNSSETQTAKLWRQKWKNWNWSSGYDSQGSTSCWKRTRRMPSMESKKDSVREETCSYRHDEDKRANWTPKAAESSESLTHRGWSASRKRTSECGVHLGGSLDSCAKTTWDVFAPNHSVIIGILLKVNSIIQNRDVNSVMCSFAQAGWRSTWQKKRKRMVSNVQWLYPVGLRISGHRAAGIFIDFTEEPNNLGINSTSAIHKSFAASCKHPRKQRSAARNIQLKIPHQRSP